MESKFKEGEKVLLKYGVQTMPYITIKKVIFVNNLFEPVHYEYIDTTDRRWKESNLMKMDE